METWGEIMKQWSLLGVKGCVLFALPCSPTLKSEFAILITGAIFPREPRLMLMTSSEYIHYSWMRRVQPSSSKNIRQNSCFTKTRQASQHRKPWRLRARLPDDLFNPTVHCVRVFVGCALVAREYLPKHCYMMTHDRTLHDMEISVWLYTLW